uniref:LIM zinc-binding domain-containing protein n=1 Tax=Syphacia muris TaxID=451379 RepID=A0A158R3W0_9BILA
LFKQVKILQCKGTLREGDLVVYAERFGDDVQWHAQCFTCTECENLLVDLIYFKHGADVFCGRHHAEQIKPRCARCDELIFSEECTEAEGQNWHMSHFTCNECGIQLGGQRYIAKNERILCIPCYHRNFSLVCNTCHKDIVAEKPHITQGETHWHADERCFCCCECKKNLLGKRYSFKDGLLFCGTESCARRKSPKVSFNTKISYDTDKKRSTFVPRPPTRNPPPPPSENIYETVLPSSSRESDETEFPRDDSLRERRFYNDESHERSDDDDDDDYPKECLRKGNLKRKPQNFYSRMPPSPTQRWNHQRCRLSEQDYTFSSCSSSESDADDIYLTNYLAASLPRYDLYQTQSSKHKGLRKPIVNRARTAKNKASSNCIVS